MLRASVFNYERLDILRDIFEHSSKKLLSFEFVQSLRFQMFLSFDFAQSFCCEFRAPRYTMVQNRKFEEIVNAV